MRMTLSPEMEKLIVDTAAKYQYESVDDFLRAAVDSFEQGEALVQFEPGELQKLVDEGEQSILEHGTVSLATVRSQLADLSARRTEKVG